ncbi:sensor histidine kinase [Fulvivirga sedimenti]|uniref:histidine kinase n=1 Tax=Fulvivirga sedimenti TaxID=2879465 RepID=A0A9X1HQ87_9BACT|nr:HAMP domain-containing sensor histidine kinase [Fulvivirga sedimenti]MCA6074813.1 HAMP domain-containing histidine kinase [Fulvivirga sedimenti]MCA6075990.1 HAMP domain-containing histidine kinase [Fulvivirga sedimenti]MCA6077118.1 HAMP domain-containing histidine kinase [Fulvivirga sedimenti]
MPYRITREKSYIIMLVIILSLVGLGFIQYLMLRSNLTVSKEKYDQRIAETLALTGDEIYNRTPFSNLLSAIIRQDTVTFPIGLDSLKSAGSQFYRMYLTDRLTRAGISSTFEFAVKDRINGDIYFSSEQFEQGFQEEGNYKIPIEGIIASDCRCAPYLNIRIVDYNRQFWNNVWWYVIPAIIFLVLLTAGFVLLIRIVREQRFLNEVKNDFINHLTHEIKTPVFASSLSLKILEQKSGPDLMPYIQTARTKIEFVKMNVEKILELASLENSNKVLKLETIETAKLVGESVKNIQELNPEREFIVQSECDCEVLADSYHLKNAVINLLENAIKFSNDRIEIGCEAADSMVRISIRDYGEGIDPELRDDIFKKFFRARNGVPGFGIGLSYVKQVVSMMGGSISIESTPGRGSLFTIHIPKSR